MRILVAALVGLVGGAGAYHLYARHLSPGAARCLDRCGEGTTCRDGRCVAEGPRQVRCVNPSVRRGMRPSARRTADGETGRPPTAAELAVASDGPSLAGIDYVNPDERGEERELSSAEIDAKVRALDPRVIACIDKARGQVDYREGQVQLSFRIERSGRVEKVKVTAPAGLIRAGLAACVRPLLAGLAFPASSRAVVMRYPYSLR